MIDSQNFQRYFKVKNKLSVAIVGSTNVGKSSLYNLLCKRSMSIVSPDLFTTTDCICHSIILENDALKELIHFIPSVNENQIQKPILSIVDSPGIDIKNNCHFLNNIHISTADIIIHVIRGFGHANISHCYDRCNPICDFHSAENEILKFDLQQIENYILEIEFSQERGQYTNFQAKVALKAWEVLAGVSRYSLKEIENSLASIECKGIPLRYYLWTFEEYNVLKSLNLVTLKYFIYLFNTDEKRFLQNESDTVFQDLEIEISRVRRFEKVYRSSFKFELKLMSMKNLSDYQLANPTHKSLISILQINVFSFMRIIVYFTINFHRNSLTCWNIVEGTSLADALRFHNTNKHRFV